MGVVCFGVRFNLAMLRGTLLLFRRRVTGLAQDTEAPSAKLRRAFGTLGLVQDQCTEADIRNAYLGLAKRYHPDSGTKEADSERFISVSF